MKEMPKKVNVLEKVNLLLSVQESEEGGGGGNQEYPMSFVFGLAAGGLTPFEQDLADKVVGESLLIRISNFRLHSYFHGLELPPLPVPPGQEVFFLRVRIIGVEAVSQRELIGAMAATTQCGHDGGGCCGGH